LGNLAVDGRLITKQVLKWYVCTVFKRLKIGRVVLGKLYVVKHNCIT